MSSQAAPKVEAAAAAAAGRAAEIDLPHRDLVDRSAQFSHAFLRWLERSTTGGLPYPRVRVLEVLHCGGPAKMKDLADNLGMSARNLTTLADGLEADSLVRRISHPTDRRATLLELTDDGMAAANCSLGPRLAEIGRLFDELSPADQTRLGRSLETLTAAMNAGCPSASACDGSDGSDGASAS
jgi:DNA-binding MarR family transcriptional regulator